MTVSITENLQALQDKLGSKAASATEAKDLVYLAKSIEALLGTDLLIQSIRGDKNTKTINVKSSDTTATLTSADINNSILTLDNPDTSASKQTATFTIANVEENDVFAITIGDNTFSVTADATATVTTIRDALVIAINTTANWQEGHILMDATSVGTTKLKVINTNAGSAANLTVSSTATDAAGGTTTATITESAVAPGLDKTHGSATLTVTLPAEPALFVLQTQLPVTIKLKREGATTTTTMSSDVAFVISDGSTITEVFNKDANASVLTTKGDLETHDGTTAVRLAAGTDQQELITNTLGNIEWTDQLGNKGVHLFGGLADKPDFDCDMHHHTMTVVDNHPDNFTGLSCINPWSMSSNDGTNYDAIMYKTDTGEVRRRGNRTNSNCGMQGASYYYGAHPAPVEYEHRNKQVSFIVTAYDHNYMVFEDGAMVGTGLNNRGQLGKNNTDYDTFYTYQTLGHFNGSSKETSVRQVTTTGSSTSNTVAVLTEDGKVWTTGRNNVGQCGVGYTIGTDEGIDNFTEIGLRNISRVWGSGYSTSTWFYAWSEKDKILYAWGYGGSGQMGQGDDTGDKYTPTVVPLPDGKELKALYTTGYCDNSTNMFNTMLLMTDGTVYAIGNGYLPDGDASSHYSFFQMGVSGEGHQLHGNDDAHSVDRMWHTGHSRRPTWYARMKDGTTTSWGLNGSTHARCFASASDNNYRPYVTIVPMIRNIKKMKWSNDADQGQGALILTDENEVWTIGRWGHGLRGQAIERDQSNPTRVFSTNGDQFQRNIIDISVGGYNTTTTYNCMTSDYQGYTWGYNGHYQVWGSHASDNFRTPFQWTSATY